MNVYQPDPNLPPAWIIDIDGTLADGHFGEPGRRGPFDWSRVGEDDLNRPVAAIVRAIARDAEVIYLSGRSEECLGITRRWLRSFRLPGGALLMRRANDFRPDAEVKSELFWRDIAPNRCVLGVLDDRDSVVAMWRGMGLMCAQVAPGNF